VEALLLSHYNEWQMPENISKAIEELFDMCVYLYAATHKPDHIDFDFVLLHLLTGMHGVQKVQSYLDETTMKRLLCNFFYLSLAFYISQLQPKIDEHLIDDYKVVENNFNWNHVVDKALHSKMATDPHLVKAIWTLKTGEVKYGSKNGLYLKAAVKTVDNLNLEAPWDYYNGHEPWIGMRGSSREMNIKH